MKARTKTLIRGLAVAVLALAIFISLREFDGRQKQAGHQEKLYIPSGDFLVESTLGFREAAADYLWFRFIQYYGAFSLGQNDLRYFDLLIDGITKLDPQFEEAYYFASLVRWSSFGDIEGSIDMLKRGILANPDKAKLPFQIGFIYYVIEQDYQRAGLWFEMAGRCSDATDKEPRFAAFARYKGGDKRVSLALWKNLYESTDSPQMKELALKMIDTITGKIEFRKSYGKDFIGPIPEI
jgi:tetratricopeptide (TPR) repeat protein